MQTNDARAVNASAWALPTRPYFPELDGVRAIAALMVMAFHYSQDWYWKSFMIFGQTGVDLFFVLSGFLITLILLQAKPGDWGEMRRFYIRRTLRIFPLYYGYLALVLLLGGAMSGWYWFYAQNIAMSLQIPLSGPYHFWSLAVEEQFYLVWPLLILFAPRRRLASILGGTIFLAIVARIVLAHTNIDGTQMTICRMDALAAGSLLAYFYSKRMIERARKLLWLGVAVGLVTMGVEWRMTHGTGLLWVQAVKYCSSELLYVSIIGLVIGIGTGIGRPITPVHRLLRSSPMRALGRVSYGMYVFHPAIFGWLPEHLGHLPLVLKACVSFAAVYLVSVASFYGFERWFTMLKDRLAPERLPVNIPIFAPPENHPLAEPAPLRMMKGA